MELDITKEQREKFEKYLKEHPIDPNVEYDEFTFYDDRMHDKERNGTARLIKRLLEGKIKLHK